MLPPTPAVIMSAYFLFRAFDMFKIYPANKFEEMGGGFGIMMDDIVAVDMFLIEKDESQKIWKQISMKQFRELLVDWRIKFQ